MPAIRQVVAAKTGYADPRSEPGFSPAGVNNTAAVLSQRLEPARALNRAPRTRSTRLQPGNRSWLDSCDERSSSAPA